MMKMLVKLSEQKAKEQGIDINYVWDRVHDAFNRGGHFILEILPDGSELYSGNRAAEPNFFAYFGIAYTRLARCPEFMKICEKWIHYDNEDDESLPMQEVDCYAVETRPW